MQEIFTAVFTTISNWKPPRYSSTIDWLNKLCHIAITEHRKTAIKMNKRQLYEQQTTYDGLKNVEQKLQSKQVTYCCSKRKGKTK